MVYVTLSADTVRSTHWRKTLSITDVTAQIKAFKMMSSLELNLEEKKLDPFFVFEL